MLIAWFKTHCVCVQRQTHINCLSTTYCETGTLKCIVAFFFFSIKMKWAKTTGAFDICNMSVVLTSPAYSTCRKTSLKLLQYDTRVSTQRVSKQFINKIPRRRIKLWNHFIRFCLEVKHFTAGKWNTLG